MSDSPQISVLPPAGPLEQWPDVTTAQAAGMLEQALSGLALGLVDHAAQARLTMLDPAIAAAVVASWIRRGFAAGLVAGRAEVVDEAPVVQQVRAQARATAKKLTTALAARAEVYGWWRDATTERDEALEDLEQLVAEITTAAVEAALVVDDDTADTRAALRTLLAQLEQTAGPLTQDGRR
jgi:hypothetical protein